MVIVRKGETTPVFGFVLSGFLCGCVKRASNRALCVDLLARFHDSQTHLCSACPISKVLCHLTELRKWKGT